MQLSNRKEFEFVGANRDASVIDARHNGDGNAERRHIDVGRSS